MSLDPISDSEMQVDKCEEENIPKKYSFKIENNILIGDESSQVYTNIGSRILGAFKSRPSFIGQIDAETGEKVTFQEMKEKSVKLALWMQRNAINENSVVTICTGNQMQAYIPFLACIYLNLIVNPWDNKFFKDSVRIVYFLLEYNPDVIFMDSENFTALKLGIMTTRLCDEEILPRIILFDKSEKDEILMSECDFLDSILNTNFDDVEVDTFECAQHSPKCNAVLMYSSNRINYPGEAGITYEAFTAPSNSETPIMRDNDVGLWYESLNWTHSLLLTIRAILNYVTVIKSSKFDVKNLCKTIEKYKVTWVFLKSNMCYKLSNIYAFHDYDLSSLKTLLIGDTKLRNAIYLDLILSLPDACIVQVYAHSELGIIAYQRYVNGPIGSSGFVSKNVRLMIVDRVTRLSVGSHKLGEIWCRVPTANVHDALKMKQSKHDLDRTDQGWYYTGDVGYFDQRGNIFVIEKARNMFKYSNCDIAPTEVEETLLYHPGISRVVVICTWNKFCGKYTAIIFIVKKPGETVTKKMLRTLIQSEQKFEPIIIGEIRFIENSDIPYLPNGDIDRLKICLIPYEIE